MSLEMILNELSLQPADNKRKARKWMSMLIRTMINATSHNVSRTIRTESGIFDITLAENYPLSRWLNDHQVDRAERRYIKSLTTKSPFWDDSPELYEQILASEFRHDNQLAKGLGVAYLLEALAISLCSKDCWDSADIFLQASKLSEENEGKIEEERVKVAHASQASHIEELREWIQTRLQQDIRDGADLWKRRSELLPSLIFCDTVASQLQQLSPIMQRPVARRLFQLENYCQNWTTSAFEPKELPTKASPESQATLNQYAKERTFLCPDDEQRIFSWHLRLTLGAWRLYFYPLPESKQIIIGYIGPHLPTMKYH